MGKVNEKLEAVRNILILLWSNIGMDAPSNHEEIVQFVFEDVCETADPDEWHSGDVAIAFRRWIESQAPAEHDYFKIVHKGWQSEIGREEIQIHAGEHGNVFIFQDGDKLGFIVDVYGENEYNQTMTAWEEDLDDTQDDDDPLSEDAAPENFSELEVNEFKKSWEQSHEAVCSCLGYDSDDDGSSEMLIGDGYFWISEDMRWYPKCSSMYSEREQAIADYLNV